MNRKPASQPFKATDFMVYGVEDEKEVTSQLSDLEKSIMGW